MKDIPQYLLGGLISIGFFVSIYLIAIVAIPEANKEAALMLLGALSAKFADVVSYYFGSSKSSSDKNAMIAKNNEAKKDEPI